MAQPLGQPARSTPPRAEASIDLGAYRRNIAALREGLADGAQLWAVVKANGYGHDVDHLAQAAVAAGAKRLCLATLSEARHLRQNGIRVPLLVMGPLDASSMRRAIDLDVSFTVLSPAMLDALGAARRDGRRAPRATRPRAPQGRHRHGPLGHPGRRGARCAGPARSSCAVSSSRA